MTFLESLQAHKGGLICLKTQLYWYKGRRWDNNPGRVCLILDAATVGVAAAVDAATTTTVAAFTSATSATSATADSAAAHLLIDGQPAWIWVAEQDIELLVNDQPIS